MAIGEHKNKSPYHGVGVTCFFMIAVPVIAYIAMHAALFEWQPEVSAELNEASARAIGFGVGVFFHLGCIIAGVLKDSLKIVVGRVVEFFDNLKFSFKLAWKCYIDQLRDGGVAFWIMFGIMVVNFCVCSSSLKHALTLLFE